jgi:hypothetical protein
MPNAKAPLIVSPPLLFDASGRVVSRRENPAHVALVEGVLDGANRSSGDARAGLAIAIGAARKVAGAGLVLKTPGC